ncbi:hypothetical protein [Escherichia coli]|uniref:hypothetical protein n=1 Tax=Escherichia coli TaxID=562 RepID=UPI0024B3D564|nr:hypothetical protein [Escherichia coli]WHD61891.1 hypothetical protein QJA99_09220 [Escherichia coli]
MTRKHRRYSSSVSSGVSATRTFEVDKIDWHIRLHPMALPSGNLVVCRTYHAERRGSCFVWCLITAARR